MKTQTLYYQDDRADKIYTATENAGVVQFSWGRRGGTMQTKTVGPLPAAEASKLYLSKLNEKLAKGYHPGQDATPLETVGFAPSGQSGHAVPTGQIALVPKPMLLNEIGDEELLALAADPDFWMQEKFDGNRIMLVKRDGALTSYSRTGRETRALPKPIVAAAIACAADFILDGEIVGDVVWAFDLMSWGSVSLREQPYAVRFLRLLDAFTNSASGIHVVEAATTPDDKLAMFARVRAAGGEGVVLKRASAAYQSGRPNSGGPALKYKFWASASVIVSGLNVQSSFGMKLYDGSDLGRCTIPPNKKAPAIGAVVEIRYLNVSPGGSLYQPVWIATRTDIAPEECTADQLEFKGEKR